MTDAQGQMTFPPATRVSDPHTSKTAEEKITKSGKRETHCQIILDCLSKHNGSTTKELADYLIGILRYDQIWRRMADLRENGYIRRNDQIVRNGCCTFWIK